MSCAVLCTPVESARGGLFEISRSNDYDRSNKIIDRIGRKLASRNREEAASELVPEGPRRRLLASFLEACLALRKG